MASSPNGTPDGLRERLTSASAWSDVAHNFRGDWQMPRPSRGDIFGTITVNYKLFLNILGVIVFAVLFWLTRRRGVTDPV
jgi:hypothetical protein